MYFPLVLLFQFLITEHIRFHKDNFVSEFPLVLKNLYITKQSNNKIRVKKKTC